MIARVTTIGSLCALLAMLALPTAAHAGELEWRTFWNFDDRLIREDFNRLVITVHNAGSAPFDDSVIVMSGLEQWKQRLYLSPGATQHVTFDIFVTTDSWGAWQLRWGEKDAETHSFEARYGVPTRSAYLTARQSAPGPDGFPSVLFPDHITRVSSQLHTITLDHAPEWSQEQTATLLDWIARGGTLLVAPDPWGEQPRFDGELAALNESELPRQIGAGSVRRDGSRTLRATAARGDASAPAAKSTRRSYALSELSPSQWTRLFQGRIDWAHPWGLIILACCLYAFAVIFGSYWIARHSRGLLLPLGSLCAFIALGTGSIFLLGRSGYNATNSLGEFTYIRPLGETRADVTRIATLFCTDGGTFAPYESAQPQLFAELERLLWYRQETEQGGASNGVFQLPLFASENFVHRCVEESPRYTPYLDTARALPTPQQLHDLCAETEEIDHTRIRSLLQDMEIRLVPDAPRMEAYVQLGEHVFEYSWKRGEGHLGRRSGQGDLGRVEGLIHTRLTGRPRVRVQSRTPAQNSSVELYLVCWRDDVRNIGGEDFTTATIQMQHYTLVTATEKP